MRLEAKNAEQPKSHVGKCWDRNSSTLILAFSRDYRTLLGGNWSIWNSILVTGLQTLAYNTGLYKEETEQRKGRAKEREYRGNGHSIALANAPMLTNLSANYVAISSLSTHYVIIKNVLWNLDKNISPNYINNKIFYEQQNCTIEQVPSLIHIRYAWLIKK